MTDAAPRRTAGGAARHRRALSHLLGDAPSLTRIEVAEQAGVPLEVAVQLWRLLGFAAPADDEVAFTAGRRRGAARTPRPGQARHPQPRTRQAALVRTWGRSFARLAEWQTTLLADVAAAEPGPVGRLTDLAAEVLPRVEALQTYVWRRHLASASSRLLGARVRRTGHPSSRSASSTSSATPRAASRTRREPSWSRGWSASRHDATGVVVDHGGRIIKTIGDEVLFVADDPAAAAEVALVLTARGRPRRPVPGGARRHRLRRRGLAGSATSSARPSTSPPGSPRSPGPARCSSTGRPRRAHRHTTAAQDDGEPPWRFRRARRVPAKGSLPRGLAHQATLTGDPVGRRESPAVVDGGHDNDRAVANLLRPEDGHNR